MTQNLLNENNNNQIQEPQLDESKNYHSELVGEGKKFKDDEALARGKWISDNYIQVLERRLDERNADYTALNAEYNAGLKLSELLDRMNTQNNQQLNVDPNLNTNEVKQPEFDPNQIKSLVSEQIQQHELNRRETENYNMVESKLKEHFGTNYQNALKEQIASLGMDVDTLNSLARKSPKALLRTLGIDVEEKNNFQAPPRNTKRNDNFAPKSNKRTWSYYQEMRRTNPDLYNNPKTTIQMHKDAIELGDEFKDGNWND